MSQGEHAPNGPEGGEKEEHPAPKSPPAARRVLGASARGAMKGIATGQGMAGVTSGAKSGALEGAKNAAATGTSSAGADKPSAKDEAKGALKSAAVGAVAGAKGGWVGAAAGAAKNLGVAMVKSSRGRKVIATIAIVSILPMFALPIFTVGLMTTAMSVLSNEQADTNSAEVVASDTGKETSELGQIATASDGTGVPWQILAALREGDTQTGVTTPLPPLVTTALECPATTQADGGVTLIPSAAKVLRCAVAQFPDVATWEADGTQAEGEQKGDGRTIFALVPDADSDVGKNLGDRVSAWFTANSKVLGVQSVTWGSQIWTGGDEWAEAQGGGSPDRVSIVLAPEGEGGAEPATNTSAPIIPDPPSQPGSEESTEQGDQVQADGVGERAAAPASRSGRSPEEPSEPDPSPEEEEEEEQGTAPEPDDTPEPEPSATGEPDPSQSASPSTGEETGDLPEHTGPWPGPGIGPYGLSPEAPGLDPEAAEGLDYSTQYVSAWLSQRVQDLVSEPDGGALSSGVVPGQDGGLELAVAEETGAEGEHVDADRAALAARVRESWVSAIESLPIPGMDRSRAEKVYDKALAWYLGKSQGASQCSAFSALGPDGQTVTDLTVVYLSGPNQMKLTPGQLEVASAIISKGAQMGVGERAQVIALMTALQESFLRNLANNGSYVPKKAPGEWHAGGKGQADIPSWSEWLMWLDKAKSSMNMPHDGDSSDWDSVGILQMRESMGYGTVQQLMDPSYQAEEFYKRLLAVPGWENLGLGEAAQKVQRSAYPTYYSKWEPTAREILAGLGGVTCTDPTASISGWTHPLPPSAGITSRYGPRDLFGNTFHAGTDMKAPEGTDILAAADGVVKKVGGCQSGCVDPEWGVSGFFVVIDHGGGFETVYTHMLGPLRPVMVGQNVTAGQPVGKVGMSGNTTGAHLHFGVKVNGKYTDPEPFMLERCVDLSSPSKQIEGCQASVGGNGAPGDIAPAIAFARAQIGKGYSQSKQGGTGPDWWDCSGLTQAAFRAAGISLPRTAQAQYDSVRHISESEARPGDLVFYSSSGSPSHITHVAMYTGGGRVVHAANPKMGVYEGPLYRGTMVGFGRPA